MNGHPSEPSLQECGCVALASIASRNDGNSVSIAAAGGIAAIVGAMKGHPS
eukprot:CAMPEP_0184650788 /NCGR_PEP_ID=MMETSP0308-20130426/8357_1 /TAXON_ID=38269 /ORGANISM="Gloeochaete witrockiana, Strain SAG 46.84" /LENGTH=50 /DNA_ID=CAMNT_0027084571 /DNA_START=1 /DNA_END=150 /DNA_ORIENTATION=+